MSDPYNGDGKPTYFTAIISATDSDHFMPGLFSQYIQKKYSPKYISPAYCTYLNNGNLEERIAYVKQHGGAAVMTGWTPDKHSALMAIRGCRTEGSAASVGRADGVRESVGSAASAERRAGAARGRGEEAGVCAAAESRLDRPGEVDWIRRDEHAELSVLLFDRKPVSRDGAGSFLRNADLPGDSRKPPSGRCVRSLPTQPASAGVQLRELHAPRSAEPGQEQSWHDHRQLSEVVSEPSGR